LKRNYLEIGVNKDTENPDHPPHSVGSSVHGAIKLSYTISFKFAGNFIINLLSVWSDAGGGCT